MSKRLTFREIQEEITNRRDQIMTLRCEIAMLVGLCEKKGHQIVPRLADIREQLKKDKWASTGAYCKACGKDFGWWCPESPDHICHYDKGDSDQCDFCGMPSERK